MDNMKFKACPKCHGTLYYAIDQFGTYWDCIACGHLIYIDKFDSMVIEPKKVTRLPTLPKGPKSDQMPKTVKEYLKGRRRWRM